MIERSKISLMARLNAIIPIKVYKGAKDFVWNLILRKAKAQS